MIKKLVSSLLVGILLVSSVMVALADWAPDTDLSASGASFWGEHANDGAGVAVAGAGDVNNDGRDDILIGAYGDDDGGNEAGQAYLLLSDYIPPTTLGFNPDEALVCDVTTVEITLDQVTDLYGYQFEVNYDDSLASASGAFLDSFFDTSGATIPPGWDGTCAAGVCRFAASLVAPDTPVSGSHILAEIELTWLAAGTFDLTYSANILADKDGGTIAHTTGTSALTVCGYADASGVVALQGRATPIDAGTVTLTDLGSVFSPTSVPFDLNTGAWSATVKVLPAESDYQFDAAHSLYLGNRMTQVLNPGDVYAAPTTTLLGGDADNSGLIDVSDLACVGGDFGNAPPTSDCGGAGSPDINADDGVNILDLVLTGGNYDLGTPQAW